MMLELYETVEVEGKQYVRKERLDELQQQFDAVCQAHTEFVDKVYAALRFCGAKLPDALPPEK